MEMEDLVALASIGGVIIPEPITTIVGIFMLGAYLIKEVIEWI